MNKKMMLQVATKLSKSEMKSVKGGVSADEYCATLREIATNNTFRESFPLPEYF